MFLLSLIVSSALAGPLNAHSELMQFAPQPGLTSCPNFTGVCKTDNAQCSIEHQMLNNDRIVRSTVTQFDGCGCETSQLTQMGPRQWMSTNSYDDGRLVRESDTDGDGWIDQVSEQFYAPNGGLELVELDLGADGTLDSTTEFFTSLDGTRVQQTRDALGQVTRGFEVGHDQGGTWMESTQGDQVRSLTEIETEVVDGGRRQRMLRTTGAGQLLMEKVTYTDTTMGKVLWSKTKQYVDGKLVPGGEETRRWTYDDQGRMLSWTRVFENDPTRVVTNRWLRDCR